MCCRAVVPALGPSLRAVAPVCVRALFLFQRRNNREKKAGTAAEADEGATQEKKGASPHDKRKKKKQAVGNGPFFQGTRAHMAPSSFAPKEANTRERPGERKNRVRERLIREKKEGENRQREKVLLGATGGPLWMARRRRKKRTHEEGRRKENHEKPKKPSSAHPRVPSAATWARRPSAHAHRATRTASSGPDAAGRRHG